MKKKLQKIQEKFNRLCDRELVPDVPLVPFVFVTTLFVVAIPMTILFNNWMA